MKVNIEVDLKWFCFRQNNSGGHWDIDENVAHYVFIQARNSVEAKQRGELFLDNSNSCPCCGDRWSFWLDDEDGTDEPMSYDKPIREVVTSWWPEAVRLHFYDGRIEAFDLPQKEKS